MYLIDKEKDVDVTGNYLLAGAAGALALGFTIDQLQQGVHFCTSLLFLASAALSVMAAWRRWRG